MKRVSGSAHWASNWLRVKAAVAGVVIFRSTEIIQRPNMHGGVGSVVRQIQDDRLAWPAVRAVDVGISATRVGGIKKFSQAIIADWEIRRNAGCRVCTPLAFADGKFIQADRDCRTNFDVRDASGRRWVRVQILHKSLEPKLSTLQKNLDAFFTIQHPSGKGVGAGQTIDKRPEAHTLHYAANSNGTCAGHAYSDAVTPLPPCSCGPASRFAPLCRLRREQVRCDDQAREHSSGDGPHGRLRRRIQQNPRASIPTTRASLVCVGTAQHRKAQAWPRASTSRVSRIMW